MPRDMWYKEGKMIHLQMMFQIGLAEDDGKIAALIKTGLEEQGYRVRSYGHGQEALQAFLEGSFDLLILDIMMPVLNGIEICRQVRVANRSVPILMLTALGTVDDKIGGLNAGADDYLVKPFHFKELIARIEALLRRYQPKPDKGETPILSYEDISIDIYSKEVKRAGKTIELTAKEYALLELFLQNPNRLMSRQFIAEKVWGIHFDTGTNVIDVYINFLRNKIEKGFGRKLIHTRIGMGYVLK